MKPSHYSIKSNNLGGQNNYHPKIGTLKNRMTTIIGNFLGKKQMIEVLMENIFQTHLKLKNREQKTNIFNQETKLKK